MYHLRRLTITSIFLGLLVFILWFLPQALNPTPPTPDEKRRDKRWVDTSPYWIDRQTCRWLGLCGLHHVHWDPPALSGQKPIDDGNDDDHDDKGGDDNDDGDLRRLELRSVPPPVSNRRWSDREPRDVGLSWEREEAPLHQEELTAAPTAEPTESIEETTKNARKHRGDTSTTKKEHQKNNNDDKNNSANGIPDYVLAYAPLVHLYSGENFWPSHIAEHVQHMTPFYSNGTPVDFPRGLTLNNLSELNFAVPPGPVSLTSDDDVETRPEWLHSHNGIPLPFGDDNGRDGEEEADEELEEAGEDDNLLWRPFRDDTTWNNVDREHPLRRVSDPRKLRGYARFQFRRIKGPYDIRLRQRRARGMIAVAGVDTDEEGGENQPADAYPGQTMLGPKGGAGFTHNVPSEGAQRTFDVGYKPDDSGYSAAPAILVLVDKGSGILDAFWFFFYSYNLGQTVLKVRYGNHVGDWEHCMIRFENGVPRGLFMSEHAGGQAYAWNALEKYQPPPEEGDESGRLPPMRPVIYSAVGSHAMYAFPGNHPYVLPFQMLRDQTDKGPLWDPALNNLAYHYDYEKEDDFEHSLVPAATNPNAPTNWFHFDGNWGDTLYALGDPRQYRLFGQYHYVTGPLGPKFKNLDRKNMCQTERCRILQSLEAGKKSAWYN